MPKINDPRKPLAKKTSARTMLDQLTTVKEHDSGGLHMSLYGRGKTGKTRLISTFPKPIAILGAEDGTKSIQNVDGVYFVRVVLNKPKQKGVKYILIDELQQFVEEVRDSDFKTVAVDTASHLQDLYLAQILGLDKIPEQKDWGMATIKEYGELGLKMKTVLWEILGLKQNVVITAHEKNFNEGNESDSLLPSIGSALGSSTSAWLNGAVDYVCQTFIREETKTVKKKGLKGKVIVKKEKTGRCEYCLRTGPSPIYITGFRLPPESILPDVIVNPTYRKIMDVIEGENGNVGSESEEG
mgnify:CR=1 FL=1